METDRIQKELEILVTYKKTNPLLGLDWMKKLVITPETGDTVPQKHQVEEHQDITTLKTKFEKLFYEIHTVNGWEVKIPLKEDAKLIQQKGRPIPIYLQQSVGKEIEKPTKQGHSEKSKNNDVSCFVSPAVFLVEKDKSIEDALDSRKLKEITGEKAQLLNMEELNSPISRKIADDSRRSIR